MGGPESIVPNEVNQSEEAEHPTDSLMEDIKLKLLDTDRGKRGGG